MAPPQKKGTRKLRSNQESTEAVEAVVFCWYVFLFVGSCDQKKHEVQTGDTVCSFCTHLLGTQKNICLMFGMFPQINKLKLL